MAKKKKSSAPAQASPLDYGALMAQANASAAESARAQVQAQVDAYPQMEALQLGTVSKIAGNLDNQYTTDARNSASQLGGLGSWMAGNARDTYASSGPTSIEQELYRQGEADLALGRSLSPAEIRDAQQSARAAMAARGLTSSQSTTAAEILNRDSYAQARESARRNFAGAANDMQFKNVMARRDQAGQQASLGANMLGSSAQMMTNIDPYARALGHSGIGAGVAGNLNQMVGSTYGNALGMAGNVASFNSNVLDSRYNSYQNNQAALQAARMQAGAANRAATMGMIGSAIQGGMQAGGMVGLGQFGLMSSLAK
jgi:hypothetical protein